MYEYEVSALFNYMCEKEGAQESAYGVIISSGENHPYVHYNRHDRLLKDGDFLVVDAGPDLDYYDIDITTSFPANGRFTPRQREVYEASLAVHEANLQVYRPGLTLEQCRHEVEAILKKRGFDLTKDYFQRMRGGFGHFVGMATHDVGGGPQVLKPGMVFANEPYMTWPGEDLGVRVEDTILITETGCENLTAGIPRSVKDIEDTMAAARTSVVLPMSGSAWAGSSVNVVANSRQPVFTHGRTQYAAFYDADRFMVLARRSIDGGPWETRRSAYQGNAADAHNSISLVVDGAGILHVAWDHHGNPLNYVRGAAPGSIDLGPRQPMTGHLEDRVTYPQFHRLPGGDLLFLYRDGASGRGNLVLTRYTVATGRWTAVQTNLIDGEGARSPYWDMTIDRRGGLHLAWVWRESPDVATNHDLCYARSDDGGRTWSTSGGAPLAVPMSARTAEYAARIPQRSNLMNAPAIAADEAGRPYVVTYWSPEPAAPPRFHVVHHDGAAWRFIEGPAQPEAFTLEGRGTKAPPISRAVVLVEASGRERRVHLVFRDPGAARSGRVVAATLEGPDAPSWSVRELVSGPVGAWEPAVDPAVWSDGREAHMLVQRVVTATRDDRTGVAPPTPIGLLVWKPR